MRTQLATDLRNRIEIQYKIGGYSLGWKFLYGPEATLDTAQVAFIGLNPGGDFCPTEHADFSNERGSAYAVESWDGAAPRKSNLQRQVLTLFDKIGERPEAVLAGNLVPFRSPSWGALQDKQNALRFGKGLWTSILAEVKPRLVICMAGDAHSALQDILAVRETERVPVGWGSICGERSSFAGGSLVRVPHLSRFKIMSRTESQMGLRKLLAT